MRHTRAFSALIGRVLEASANDASEVPSQVDAVHLASLVTGSTVFFVAAMPALLPGSGFDPLQRERLEGHRSEVLDIVRRLLGAPPS